MRDLGQVVWVTGLPACGKSTFARALVRRVKQLGESVVLLDGDEVHAVFSDTPHYDARSRARFYRGLANLGALLAKQGHTVVIAATAHKRAYRAYARKISPRFIEIYLRTPLAECAARDPKGLYARGLKKPGTLPGLGVDYEPPEHPEVLASGGKDRLALARALAHVVVAERPALRASPA